MPGFGLFLVPSAGAFEPPNLLSGWHCRAAGGGSEGGDVEGYHHGDQLVYDARRDRWLGEMGFRVLRFWVAEVDENIEGLIENAPLPASPRGAGGGRVHPKASRPLGDRRA